MADYILEEKNSFIVLGFGTELKSNYKDIAGLNKEKSDFWKTVNQDGRLDTLKAIAINDYVFAVNEAVNNKLMHYAGVMSESSAPEGVRVIQFPKGQYLIVKGEGNNADELENKLTSIAFGKVLQEAKNFAYVGGPNAMVEIEHQNDLIVGEMWIPVVRK